MVEGPTAKAYAIKISREFSGEIVKDVVVKTFRRIHIPLTELFGKRFVNADSLGKNILLFFDGLAVRVHLMMYGAIHIYNIDEDLLKPERLVRLLVKGCERKLVVYNAPIVEIDRAEGLVGRLKGELGPDPLSSDWDKGRAIENLLKFKGEKVGVALLNQSIIAGVGNILRNEILFRAGVNPERTIGSLTMVEIEKIVDVCESLSKEFLKMKIEGKRIGPLLMVYNKYNGICKVCGGKIRFYMQKPINRKTFVCTNCQK
jgi:endonuclease-8